MGNKILDILKSLSIDFDQTDNYINQWRNKKFYLDYVFYEGREVKIEDVKELIMDEIKKHNLNIKNLKCPEGFTEKVMEKIMKGI